MFTADVSQVYGQTGAAPDELEVVSSFNFGKALEDAPEACNNRVVSGAVVWGNRLKSFDRNYFFTSTSAFKSLPVAEGENIFIVLYDSQEAQTNGLNLIFGFIGTDLEYLIAKLIDVAFCNLDGFAIGANWNLYASGENSSELLVDSSFEIFIA